MVILAMLFLYFEGFIFRFGGNSYTYYYILMIFLLFLSYIFFCGKHFLVKLKFLYLKTPFKYLVYFIAWLFIDAIILILTQKATILIFYYIVVKLLIPAMICYMISSVFIPKYISLKFAIRLLLLFMFGFICLGFIGFIGDTFNISFFQSIVNSISNLKELMVGGDTLFDATSGSARARSVFHEPGSFAKYILLISPIVYKICLSKYKIFKNNFCNCFFKYTLIPLSLICVILTKSPIFFIFMFIFLISYFYKNILFLLKKYFILISLFCIYIILFLINTSVFLEKTYLARIFTTIKNMNDFYSFVILEPSLASRVVSYINSFLLFLQKPFIGYGIDNVRFYMTQQFLNSPVPLTFENIDLLKDALVTSQGTGYNKSLLTCLLSETGLIGTGLYFLFLYKHIKYIDKLKIYFTGIEEKFLDGLKFTIIIVIISSFYIYSFATSYLYLYYGFVCSFVTQYYLNKRKEVLK